MMYVYWNTYLFSPITPLVQSISSKHFSKLWNIFLFHNLERIIILSPLIIYYLPTSSVCKCVFFNLLIRKRSLFHQSMSVYFTLIKWVSSLRLQFNYWVFLFLHWHKNSFSIFLHPFSIYRVTKPPFLESQNNCDIYSPWSISLEYNLSRLNKFQGEIKS